MSHIHTVIWNHLYTLTKSVRVAS